SGKLRCGSGNASPTGAVIEVRTLLPTHDSCVAGEERSSHVSAVIGVRNSGPGAGVVVEDRGPQGRVVAPRHTRESGEVDVLSVVGGGQTGLGETGGRGETQ